MQLIATAMDLTAVAPAQRHDELVADLAPQRRMLRQAKVVGIRGAGSLHAPRHGRGGQQHRHRGDPPPDLVIASCWGLAACHPFWPFGQRTGCLASFCQTTTLDSNSNYIPSKRCVVRHVVPMATAVEYLGANQIQNRQGGPSHFRRDPCPGENSLPSWTN